MYVFIRSEDAMVETEPRYHQMVCVDEHATAAVDLLISEAGIFNEA